MVCLWCTQDSSTVKGAKNLYWLVMQKLKRIESSLLSRPFVYFGKKCLPIKIDFNEC